MSDIVIDQESGSLTMNGEHVGSDFKFEKFKNIFSSEIRLIYGKDETAKYGLINPVNMFGMKFRIYFLFEEGGVRNCTMELIENAVLVDADYPSYSELQQEVEHLFQVYKTEFMGAFSSKYKWKKVWSYNWGRIVLAQEAHNSRVITEIIWG